MITVPSPFQLPAQPRDPAPVPFRGPAPSVPLREPASGAAIRLDLEIALAFEVGHPGADFLFLIQLARTTQQRVVDERLDLGCTQGLVCETDPLTQARLLRLTVPPGRVALRYQATVELRHLRAAPATLLQMPVGTLPRTVLPYLLPSRYCPSDALGQHPAWQAVIGQLLNLPPGAQRLLALERWVRQRVRFTANSSNGLTTALDTLRDGVGVCRDFAHLLITGCRALNLPARFTTGLDYGADPILGPPDFHAYVEVWLSGRWWICDPSGTAIPEGFVRLASGRDAADVAFATSFGPVTSFRPIVSITARNDSPGGAPRHRDELLSTDG